MKETLSTILQKLVQCGFAQVESGNVSGERIKSERLFTEHQRYIT